MELIIKLLLGTAGFGALSWASWGFASSHDTGLMLTAMALGFVAFICGFLAIAKIIHYSKWAATLFWTVMLGTLTYTFPPLGLTQLGWLGWGIITFLSGLSSSSPTSRLLAPARSPISPTMTCIAVTAPRQGSTTAVTHRQGLSAMAPTDRQTTYEKGPRE